MSQRTFLMNADKLSNAQTEFTEPVTKKMRNKRILGVLKLQKESHHFPSTNSFANIRPSIITILGHKCKWILRTTALCLWLTICFSHFHDYPMSFSDRVTENTENQPLIPFSTGWKLRWLPFSSGIDRLWPGERSPRRPERLCSSVSSGFI